MVKEYKESKEKIRILYYGDSPSVSTGFGTVSRNILVPLYNTGKYDITVLGVNYWGNPHPYKFQIWPVGNNPQRDPYGKQLVQERILSSDFDILFMVQDSFILDFVEDLLPKLKMANKKFKSVCFSGDTEILTREGIKNIKDVKIGDLALSYDTISGRTLLKKVTDVYEVPYDGDMISMRGQSVDFMVTPDHRMYLRRESSKNAEYKWTTAGEVYDRANSVREKFPCFKALFNEGSLYPRIFKVYEKIDTSSNVVISPRGRCCDFRKKAGRLYPDIFSGEKKLNSLGKEISAEYDHHIRGYRIPLYRFADSGVDLSEFAYKCNCEVALKSRTSDRSYIPVTIDMEDFLRLGAWYITEGCATYYIDKDGKKVYNELSIASNIYEGREVNYRKHIKNLLDRIDIRYREKEKDFLIKGSTFVSLFCDYFGNGAVNKKFPDWFFDLDVRLLRVFFDELLLGDGDRDKGGYTTKSEKLAKSVVLLAYMLGIKAHYKHYKDEDVYKVTFTYSSSQNFPGGISLANTTKHYFKGKVYCVSVEDTHTVFAGRNGYFNVIGQCYYPIDGIPKPSWIKAMAEADYPVTYTEFGRKECIKAYPPIENKLGVIPHGANVEDFYPLGYGDIIDFREKFFGPLANKFIVTMVNRNQQRKDIPRAMMAFKEFQKKCPDSFMYIHAAVRDMGWNLDQVCNSLDLKINKDIVFPHNFGPNQGFPIDVLNKIYNASDVVISSTTGEGWGLAQTEAMAAKVPIISPDNTACTEIVGEDRGLLVKSGHTLDHHVMLCHDNEVVRPIISISDMVDKLEMMYNDEVLRLRLAENGYNWVRGNLIWDKHIVPKWIDVMDRAVEDLYGEKEVDEYSFSGAMEV